MAYGRAGSEENLGVNDVKQVASQYLTGSKVSLIWPDNMPSQEMATQRGYLKTLLNLIILAEETLAYGGIITLRDAGGTAQIEIVGRNAHLSLQLQEALDGTSAVEDLTPRSIQAYVTGRFATHFGFKLTHDHSVADRLELALALPLSPALLVNVS